MKYREAIPSVSMILLVLSTGCSPPLRENPAKQFQGSWNLIQNGKKTEELVIFNKDRIAIVAFNSGGTETGLKVAPTENPVYQVDHSKTPGQIDIVYVDGEFAGKVRHGIFEFEGDTLKIRIADFDVPRPTEFVASAGNMALVMLQRQN